MTDCNTSANSEFGQKKVCYLIQTDFMHLSQRFDYLQYVEIMATHLRAKSMAKGCVWSTSIGSDMPGLSRTI